MKKVLLLMTAVFLFSAVSYSQDQLKSELIDESGNKIEKCDCQNMPDNSKIILRIYFSENVFKYDELYVSFRQVDNGQVGSTLESVSIGKKKLQVENEAKGYVDYTIVQKQNNKISSLWKVCSAENNFSFLASASGYFITGYQEKYNSNTNTVTQSPTYGDGQDFGKTQVYHVNVHTELSKETRKNRKKAAITGAAAGAAGVGYYVSTLFGKDE